MKNYSPKILITGAEGQIGKSLLSNQLAHDFFIRACSRSSLDITNIHSIEENIAAFSPDFIINTAAYTDVDSAEKNNSTAMQINYHGAKNLAIACQKNNVSLIHLSTDYIFDGKKSSPYTEEDQPLPLNSYGESKLRGEIAVREYCESHLILRVSAVFSEHGRNFLKTIKHLAQEKKELNIVVDQITSPTYAGHIATAIYHILKNNFRSGIYHYCDAASASWYEFAKYITEKHKKIKLNPITSMEYAAPAIRPAYSVLACEKIKNDFGIVQKNWQEKI